MSNYIIEGNKVSVISEGAIDISKTLPAGVYQIQFGVMSGFALYKTNNFNIEEKLYGEFVKNSETIITTFLERPKSTGVLFSGIKGSGKTLQTKHISQKLNELNIPTILIIGKYELDELSRYLNRIEQECCIIFDEFEKYYDDDEQNNILSLLDGIYENKKLFLFTCNQIFHVNSFLLNRPGRIYYHFKFNGISNEILNEYCKDNLLNSKYFNSINKIFNACSEKVTFDVLKCIVEEVNRFNTDPLNLIKNLNIDLSPEQYDTYSIQSVVQSSNNKQLKIVSGPNIEIHSIFNNKFNTTIVVQDPNNSEIAIELDVNCNNLLSIANNNIIFKDEDYILTFVKNSYGNFNFQDYLF